MRVRSDAPAHRVRRVDDGRQFGVCQLLADARCRVRQDAAGSSDLDDVGASLDLAAYGAAAGIGAGAGGLASDHVQHFGLKGLSIAMATVRGDAASRCNNAWTWNAVFSDGAPQRENGVVWRAEIGDSGKASLKRRARVLGRTQRW